MPQLRDHWTVADRDALPDDGNRYEVIDGVLFVTPAPALRHQRAAGELYHLLREYLRSQPVGEALYAPVDLVYSATRVVQPDVLVIPLVDGKRLDRLEQAPRVLLVAEVLSPSTARADRVAKRMVYREGDVDEYWIVDLDARTFERSTPADPRIEVLADRVSWQPAGAVAPLEIDVAAYFARVLDD